VTSNNSEETSMTATPTMSDWWRYTDHRLNNRITEAVRLVFEHADPAIIRTYPYPEVDGGTCQDLLGVPYEPAPYERSAFRRTRPGVHPFSRSDYQRTSDGAITTVAAADDGRTVLFYDTLGHTLEQSVEALEKFAQYFAADI
jgi:hypothetical protein